MYGKYTLFYESPKNWGCYTHAQTVCTRPLLGREGPGDEASNSYDYQELDSAPNSDSLFPVPLICLVCYGQDEMACHLHSILCTLDAVFPLGVQLGLKKNKKQ